MARNPALADEHRIHRVLHVVDEEDAAVAAILVAAAIKQLPVRIVDAAVDAVA